jgi:hypothetical protein
MSRLADADLLALLSNSVPPVDLQRVALFRAACKKHDKQALLALMNILFAMMFVMQPAQLGNNNCTGGGGS